MLLEQNNFSLSLHIFCFISFHSGRGECCHLALVATSYKMQHPKEKNILFFAWKLESDFQRTGAKSCLPNNKSLQAHTATRSHSHAAHTREALPKLGWGTAALLLIPPFISPLYFPHLFLPTEQKQSSKASFPPYDSHFHVLLCTTSNLKTWWWTLTSLPRSWEEPASQRRFLSAKEPLQKRHSLNPYSSTVTQLNHSTQVKLYTSSLEIHIHVCTLWMFWCTFG